MKTKQTTPNLKTGDIIYKGHAISTAWEGSLCWVSVDGEELYSAFDRNTAIELAKEHIDLKGSK